MDPVLDNLDLFWSGFRNSVGFMALAAVGSVALGTVIAAFRVSPVAPLRFFGTAYVTVVRNCPLTIVLFFFAFGLPEIGINRSFYTFALVALVVYTAAFVCEALRSGINSVSAGQAEAARAIGLRFGQSMTEIVLPQAFRSAIPPLGSVLIAMCKNSAVVGVFGVSGHLMSVARQLNSGEGLPALPIYTGTAIGFLIITVPAGILLGRIERKVAIVR